MHANAMKKTKATKRRDVKITNKQMCENRAEMHDRRNTIHKYN